jgi:hypothetical protein
MRARDRMRERGGRIERVRVRVSFFLFILMWVGAGRVSTREQKNLYPQTDPHCTGWIKSNPNPKKKN